MKKSTAVFGLIAALILSSAAMAQPVLQRSERYLPNFTGTAATLDIDRDGVIDILSVPANGLGPIAYMGQGGISFAEDELRTAPVGPLNCPQLVAAEMTGDAFSDVLCASINSILLIVNNNGVFSPPVMLGGFASIPKFAVADLDGDGDQDIAAVDGTPLGVTLLTNSGTGTFTSSVPITSRSPISSIKAADLDLDQVPDLVLLENGQVKIYYTRPNNRFSLARSVPQPSSVTLALQLADIDSDGDIDIATSGFQGLRSLRNDGVSIWTLVGGTTTVLTDTTDLTFDDFNGDGKNDFIAAAGSYGGMQIFLQTATPFSFTDVTDQWLANLSRTEISSTQLADLDGDSIPEILAFAGSAGEIKEGTVLAKGAGDYFVDLVGPQGTGFVLNSPTHNLSNNPCIIDYDNDGFIDLVSAGRAGAEGVYLMRGDGAGHFSAPQILLPLPNMGVRGSCASGDFNHDGRIDFVFAAGRSIQRGLHVLLYRTASNGLVDMSQLIPTASTFSLAVSVADLNLDGFLDIIFAGIDDVPRNMLSTRILLGNASGFTSTSFPSLLSDQFTDIAVGDLDTDGDLDVFVSGTLSTRWLENLGGGNFTPNFIPFTAGASSAIIADLNQDGFKDLFITSNSNNQSNLLFNGSVNGLVSGTLPDAYMGVSSTLIDLNGDSMLDLVVGDDVGNYAGTPARAAGAYINMGALGLVPAKLPPIFSGGMNRVYAADFDGDGDQDLLTYESASSNYPHIYFNTSRQLSLTNRGRMGKTWQLEITAEPVTIVHIWASIDPVGPGFVTQFGRFRLVNPGFTGTFVVPTSGSASISIPIPALSGIGRLSFQAAFQDPSGQIRFSNVASLAIE